MKNADFGFKCRMAFLAESARREARRAMVKNFRVVAGVGICGSVLAGLLAARG
jgi:hypothetical protein